MTAPFIPKHISRIEDWMSRGIITSNYWNEIFNLLIAQGEHAQNALDDILNNNLYPLGPHVQNADASVDTRPTTIRFLNTSVSIAEDGATVIEGLVGPTGPIGPQGNPTPALILKGMYPDLVSLTTAHPTGQAGDVYLVGTTQTNTTYIWDMALLSWVNGGSIQGTPGAGIIAGGTTGQFLSKASNSDFDMTWATLTLPNELQYLTGLNQNIQTKFSAIDSAIAGANTAISGKEPTITVTASRALVSNTSGKVAASAVSSTALGYLANVTSDVQTQINGKLESSATALNATKWSGRQCFVGSSTPAGAVDGDVWFKV